MVLADTRIDENSSLPEKRWNPMFLFTDGCRDGVAMFLKDERDEPAMLTAIRGAAPDHPLLWTTK